MTVRASWLVGALLACVTVGSAAADDGAGTLADCAARHLPGDPAAAEAACIGRISGPCLSGEAAPTTLGMIDCLGAESAAWVALMTRDRPGLMAAARRMDAANDVAALNLPSFAEAEREAQRRWRAWREAECAARRAAWGAGSHGRVVAAECWLRLTAERALALRSRLMEMPR